MPTLLSTCKESRDIAKQWYELSFEGSSSKVLPRVYFDFSADFVYIPRNYACENEDRDHDSPERILPGYGTFRSDYSAKIKRFVCETSGSLAFLCTTIFPNASKLLLILGDERMVAGSAEISDCTLVTYGGIQWTEGPNLVSVIPGGCF